ncbi:hypothetical protein QBC35DRAFT_354528, partial [Podospora australis]
SLPTTDGLVDTGANGDVFVSVTHAKRLLRMVSDIDRLESFKARAVGGFDGKPSQIIDVALKGDMTIQGRTFKDQPLLVISSKHDIIIGRQFFERHDILVDCFRRRLLFPESLPTTPVKRSKDRKKRKREADEVVAALEAELEEQDRRRRN